jgi:hypothetical protein
MKTSKILRVALAGLAISLTVSAFAADKASMQLNSLTNVGGKQLPAGYYNVRWEGAGPSVELNIMKGNKLVVTVPARVVTNDNAYAYDSVVVSTNGDGSRNLSQIRFSHKKFAFDIEGASAAMSGTKSK